MTLTPPSTPTPEPAPPPSGDPAVQVIARVRLRGGDIAICRIPKGLLLTVAQACIIDLADVHEWGVVLELAETHDFDADAAAKAQGTGTILRAATDADVQQQAETVEQAEVEALRCFREHVKRLELNMRPLSARYSFDRKRVMMLFGADRKVDFRRLVYHLRHDLSGVYVEMRQLGVRDEAGHIGGFGPCGRQLCCSTWLQRFRAINIRMAKAQNLPFNPQTVNGMCGRLKCCLRYEYDQYRDAGAHFPREGAEVVWGEESGTVIARELLNGRLTVRTPDRRILHLKLCEVTLREPPVPEPHVPEPHDDTNEDDPPLPDDAHH